MERLRGLFVASGLFFVVWQALSPILPIYAVELGASITQVGLIMATLSSTLIFTRIPLGVLWGRVEPRISMAFSYGAQLASLLLYSLAPSPVWLFPTMVLLGLGLASFGPLATSTALNLAAEGIRGEEAGKFYTSIALAMLSGPFLTAALLKFLSYKQVFLILLIFPLAGLVTLTKLGGLRRGAGGAIKPFAAAGRNLLFALSATVSFFVATGIFDTLFPVYATSALFLSPAAVSLLFGVRGGVNALIRVPSGKLSDKIGRRKPLIFAYFLAFLALLSASKAGSPGPLALSMALYGLAWGLRVPSIAALIADNVPPGGMLVAMASLWMSADAGMSLGAVLAGALAPSHPAPTLFAIASVFMLLSSVLSHFIKETKFR